MKQTQPIEILAPAGASEQLRAAVYSGADCVYLGFAGFNARRGAGNFDDEGLAQAVAFCHARGCGVYAALNTLVLPGEEKRLDGAIRAVEAAGCDAVIVQDLYTAQRAAQLAPGLALHGSTQMSVHSAAGAQMLEGLGFERVILARELCEQEIAAIAAKTQVELEVFVHGALCVCLSGQCYASAFLGGRSANRGACAGPCRLPFRAQEAEAGAQRPATGEHHLSLKDLSILDALPRLQELGVASAKIEGRLRGPDYVAAVVDAARKARAGQPYDKEHLARVFSRSGFTDGWHSGENGRAMFGRRTAADAAASGGAASAARELYRREMPRVPVSATLTLGPQGGTLAVADGERTACAEIPGPLAPAQTQGGDALERAVRKTGGTPFFVREVQVQTNGCHAPAALVNAARRAALDELLHLREERPARRTAPALPLAAIAARPPARGYAPRTTPLPALRLRFAGLAQLPEEVLQGDEELLLPLASWADVPVALRARARLWLPRALFGGAEQGLAAEIEQAASSGFAGFEANNLAHLHLLQGRDVSAGFGLNLANAGAVNLAAALGCTGATLSVELSLAQLRTLAAGLVRCLRTDTICYGHLPLMLTRAQPLANARGAVDGGELVDRKGRHFALRDVGGAAELYNPVPLWMADRLAELPSHTATLYFTTESAEKAAEVLRAARAGQTPSFEYTRGLFDKGTAG